MCFVLIPINISPNYSPASNFGYYFQENDLNQALNGTTDDRKIIVSESDSDQSLDESLLVKTKTSRPKAKVLETDEESEDEAFESAKNSFNGRKDSEAQDESEQDESTQDESESDQDESSDPDEWSPDGNDQDYSALNGHSNPAEISSSEVSKMNEIYC